MCNVYNSLSYGAVGKTVYRMWESCTLAFPYAVNGVVHGGIGSYAHFHNAFLGFLQAFPGIFTGKDGHSGQAVPVRLSAALSALNTGLSSPASDLATSILFHSFYKWRSAHFSA